MILGDLAGKVTLGGYSGSPSLQVSAVQGITNALQGSGAQVYYDAAGTSTTSTAAVSLSTQTQQAIKAADLVIVVVGTDGAVAGEGHDRSTIAMPGNYDSLISQVAAQGNPRMALVVQSDGPVGLAGVQSDFPAIVFSGYNGESQGDALADVLFGKQNPSGHLDFTWYADDSQLPAMSNYGAGARGDGRPRPDLHVLHRHPDLSVRLRPELHEVQLRQPPGERAHALRRRHRDAHLRRDKHGPRSRGHGGPDLRRDTDRPWLRLPGQAPRGVCRRRRCCSPARRRRSA